MGWGGGDGGLWGGGGGGGGGGVSERNYAVWWCSFIIGNLSCYKDHLAR